ncbi:MAG TPA: hypothetical protein VMW48_11580 [Vicinamibacterales bacterium]|nr:hypothetical protein [Vicinamibacterales bacterium]
MPFPPAPARDRPGSLLLLAVLLMLAFANGVATTRDLSWPGADLEGVGIDLYRDMALAQTILDSGYGPDPNYLNERTWYNPLVPAMTAAISAATGAPVPTVVTRVGAYANLLAPVTFYLLAATLLGHRPALYAVAGFLFLTGSTLPSWISATYSPWFMPLNFAQGLFYLTVWAFVGARRSPSPRRILATGALWGLTFLAHAVPALIFGVMVIITFASDVGRRDGGITAGTALGRLVTMIVAALVVSSPLLATIVGHYGLRTLHTQPSMYTAPLLGRELPTLLWLHCTVPMFVAAAGALALARQPSSPARLTIGTWLLAAGLFLAQAYAWLAARLVAGWVLPSLVPSFHYFFYLKAATALLFGVGVTAIAARAARAPALRSWSPRALADGLCVLLLALGAPTYLARPDFAAARQDALATMKSDPVQVADWLRQHGHPTDVVLASDYDSALIPGPAGVKVVAAFNTFSNPYVDWETRAAARDQLFAALDAGDDAAFRVLAHRFAVTHVVARGRRAATYARRSGLPIEEVFAAGDVRLFRRRR